MTATPKGRRERQPAPTDHDHVDGCLCGHDQAEHVATQDHDLPPAEGGVETPRTPRRRGTRTSVGEA